MNNEHDNEYHALCQRILENGNERDNRTDIKTISVFGEKIEFNISRSFPLLTTKKMYWKGIAHELLWFLKGSSNVKELQKKNIHFWDGNTSPDYIENNSLNIEPYNIGAGYGFQWRHRGMDYHIVNKSKVEFINKTPKELNDIFDTMKLNVVDQIQDVIDTIKNNPTSRRILVDAWDPVSIKKGLVALPPCHCLFQFYVNDGNLDCQMYQRSADIFLGLPFNIASYSLLTYIIADICKLKPGRLIICIGDAHIYKNHISQVKEQVKRSSFDYPTLKIKRKLTDIDDVTFDDFDLTYKSHPSISADMAV